MSSSMVSTTGLPSGAALATAKKAAAARAAAAKKPRAKPNHPRTSDMVDAAIAALKERGGSSLQAIKKYIAGTYSVDAEKLSPFIKKYLKSGVVANKLVQTKGKGASGSFKLSLGDGAAGVNSPRRGAAVVAKRRTVAKKTAVTAAAKVKKSPAKAKKSSPKKKVLKTLAAKPPKPKAAKKPAAKKSVVARKSVVAKKPRKAPARK